MSENHCSAGLQLRDQDEDAPQAVDDRRHRGEQLDQDRQRAARARRGQSSVDVERGRDRDRHADQQRDRRGDQRADEQRQRAVDAPATTSQSLSKVKPKTPNFSNAGCASTIEADEEERDQDEDRRRQRRSGPTSAPGRAAARAAAARATERPPSAAMRCPASIQCLASAPRAAAVALERVDLGLRLGLDARRQRRVLQLLARRCWPSPRRSSASLRARLAVVLAHAGLARCPGRRAGTSAT